MAETCEHQFQHGGRESFTMQMIAKVGNACMVSNLMQHNRFAHGPGLIGGNGDDTLAVMRSMAASPMPDRWRLDAGCVAHPHNIRLNIDEGTEAHLNRYLQLRSEEVDQPASVQRG